MSSAFSSNDAEVLTRAVSLEESLPRAACIAELEEIYEIPRCVDHIKVSDN